MLKLNAASVSLRLHNVTMHCQQGQWWTLLGPNGGGKSSLLNLAAGLLHCDSGSISIDDEKITSVSLSALATRRCLVTQSYRTEFSVSVAETLYFFTGFSSIPELLEQHLEIQPLLDKPFEQLSGGEKQRVHLARNLMQVWQSINSGKALVLLDEPLQQMDIRHQASTLTLIKVIQSMGNAIVMSHHDINQALHYSSHLCLLSDGYIVKQGNTANVISTEVLESLYNQAFTLIQNESTGKHYYMAG